MNNKNNAASPAAPPMAGEGVELYAAVFRGLEATLGVLGTGGSGLFHWVVFVMLFW